MVLDKILVFVPMYNCERQITRVLAQFDERILPYVTEILLVNNRSTDGTEEAAVAYAKAHPQLPVTVVRNRENYNLGGSHKVAFQYAIDNGFDYVVVLHGDDQAQIADLLRCFENHSYRKYDVLLGARFVKGAVLEGYSALRTYGNLAFNLMYSVVTRRKIYDLGSGINMFSVDFLRDKFYFKISDSLGFNNCMLLAMCHKNARIHFFPIVWREDDQVSNLKLWSFGCFNLKILWKYFVNAEAFVTSEMREKPRDAYVCSQVFKQEGVIS